MISAAAAVTSAGVSSDQRRSAPGITLQRLRYRLLQCSHNNESGRPTARSDEAQPRRQRSDSDWLNLSES